MREVAKALTAALGLLLPAIAHALPPNAQLQLAPGADRFVRAPIDVTDVVTEPESALTAEVLPSKEILVTAKPDAKGSATLLALGLDRVYAWDVCIGKCPAATNIVSAKSACPGLDQVKDDKRSVWAVTVKDTRCLEALRDALVHATIGPSWLQVSLEEKPAVEFFQTVEKQIASDPRAKGVQAMYYGPTLKLTGEATSAAVARAVMHAWQLTVGDVAFDNQTTAPPKETPK
jgi:hypothetical protein